MLRNANWPGSRALWVIGSITCELALGCGGPSRAEKARDVLEGDGPVPVESFVRALALSVCDAAEVCEPDPYIRRFHDEGDCVEALARIVNVDFAGRVAAVGFGEASYDGAAARACLDSFAGKCPDPFRLSTNAIQPSLWCPEAFPSCPAPLKEPWRAPRAPGESCLYVVDDLCAAGSGCSASSNTCEPCTAGTDAGVDCEGQAGLHEILRELYLVDREEGARCDVPMVRAACNKGLRCVFATDSCVAPRPVGAPCPNGEECAGTCSAGQCEPSCAP